MTTFGNDSDHGTDFKVDDGVTLELIVKMWSWWLSKVKNLKQRPKVEWDSNGTNASHHWVADDGGDGEDDDVGGGGDDVGM